ncbi:MAG: hypothetical protein Q4P24_15670, partial [Rhodobacterales bacterium]|nr:hypothetical protein [Rhodobacterales bacterium]
QKPRRLIRLYHPKSRISHYVGGSIFGGIIGIYLFSLLFRYAILGPNGKKLQQLWVVMLTGVVAIGFSAFGDGTDGFTNRITNLPNMVQIISYSVSALLVSFFVWLRNDDAPPAPMSPQERGIAGRAIALVFVIPMTLIGIGNIGGSIYSLAVDGPSPGLGLGVSRAEMRDIMLKGHLAPYWRVVDERAPSDMDYIIERIFAQEDDIRSVEQGIQILNQELVNYRVSLATYASALNDEQWKEIMQSTLEMQRQYEDRPALCLDLLMTGGRNMTQEQLLSAQGLLNQNMIVMTENLLDARATASEGTSVPTPPTEEDYGLLVQILIDRGMPDDQLQALFNEDTSHPQFCQLQIAFLEAVIDLDGLSVEAVRFEVGQAMLTAAP